MAKKIFLSYARADEDFALRLARDLLDAGADMFVDRFDIERGENWDRVVESALRGCNTFVVLLSPPAVESENVMDEIHIALQAKKTVIPVVYRDCQVPMRLARTM